MTKIVQLLAPSLGSWAGLLLGLDDDGNLFYQHRDNSSDPYFWKPIPMEPPIPLVDGDGEEIPLVK